MYYVITRKMLPKTVSGMALWPVILVRDKVLLRNDRFVNHERIHLRQQAEMLVLPFYIWYGAEFLFRWFGCRNIFMAYRSISFEREAYAEENNENYLKERHFWAFAKFLKV